jgi:hypothetical protein
MKRYRLAFIVLILVSVTLIGRAQTVPPVSNGSGVISGIVTAADTGAPLPYAEVTLVGGPRKTVVANEAGEYVFAGLPAGRFVLRAWKSGFLPMDYGQRRTHRLSAPIELKNGERIEQVNFVLPKAGSIEVRVTDERGQPLRAVMITILQYTFVNNERTLVAPPPDFWGVGPSRFTQTDAQGYARVDGLRGGEYYVMASPRHISALPRLGVAQSQKGLVYADTYYPGTPYKNEGAPILLRDGEETSVTLPLAVVRTGRVTGIVGTVDGLPFAGERISFDSRATTVQADGSFVIESVPAGEHRLSLLSTNLHPREYAKQVIQTTGDDVHLDIITTRGWTLRGHFTFDASHDLTGGSLRLNAVGVDDMIPPGNQTWNHDWTFEIQNLFGSRTLGLQPTGSRGWSLKAIMIGDQDVTDRPIDPAGRIEVNDVRVILTRAPKANVTGVAVDATDRPVTDYVAVIFSEDSAFWTAASRRIATARPDQSGRFEMRNLPAGRYLIAAIDELHPLDQRAPTVLARLRERATPVTLVDGETTTLTLRMQPQ